MINVLIVDDSATVREQLEYILESDQEISVIGKVENGKQAVEFVKRQKPDLITMDIDMPVMNGLEATRQIMSTNPIPIIIITASRNAKNEAISIDSLACGALTVMEKHRGISDLNTPGVKKILSMVKIYSAVKVLKRKYGQPNKFFQGEMPVPLAKIPQVSNLIRKKYVVIGVSTGGPEVLKNIFEHLPGNFRLPILVVQHITAGFLESMVNWLNSKTELTVKIGEANEQLMPGCVYFAPDNHHMRYGSPSTIELKERCEGNKICPSVDALFYSMEKVAASTIAILLTGMGKDGALALKTLNDKGALTIAQSKESALIHGMPGEAIKLNAARYILNTEQIINTLRNIK